jgi:hypothetical protein
MCRCGRSLSTNLAAHNAGYGRVSNAALHERFHAKPCHAMAPTSALTASVAADPTLVYPALTTLSSAALVASESEI